MEFDQARKIAERLANNLIVLQNAIDFIKETREKERTFGGASTRGVFASLKQALIAYIECEGDKEKLEKFIQILEDLASEPHHDHLTHSYEGGNTLLDFINSQSRFCHEKCVDFNVEADRILKEVDAQVNALCNGFSIDKISSHLCPGHYLPSDRWDIKELQQAFNVVRAVKSLTD